jgi:putative SOS response-associated peptidase YedK
MCVSYQLNLPFKDIAKTFKAKPPKAKSWDPSKLERIRPSHLVPVIALDPETGERVIRMMNWGLPRFDPLKKKYYRFHVFNARDENVLKYRMFKSNFQKNRCLVPVNPAFIEWQQTGSKAVKKPMFLIGMKPWKSFAFAGFWGTYTLNTETDKQIDDKRKMNPKYESPRKEYDCFTFITTTPNSVVKPIHPDRMPVILDPKNYDAWLDPKIESDVLIPLLKPFSAEKMQAKAVEKV